MRRTTGLAVPYGLGAPLRGARSTTLFPVGHGSGAFDQKPVLSCGSGSPALHFSAESRGCFPGALLVRPDSRR